MEFSQKSLILYYLFGSFRNFYLWVEVTFQLFRILTFFYLFKNGEMLQSLWHCHLSITISYYCSDSMLTVSFQYFVTQFHLIYCLNQHFVITYILTLINPFILLDISNLLINNCDISLCCSITCLQMYKISSNYAWMMCYIYERKFV